MNRVGHHWILSLSLGARGRLKTDFGYSHCFKLPQLSNVISYGAVSHYAAHWQKIQKIQFLPPLMTYLLPINAGLVDQHGVPVHQVAC